MVIQTSNTENQPSKFVINGDINHHGTIQPSKLVINGHETIKHGGFTITKKDLSIESWIWGMPENLVPSVAILTDGMDTLCFLWVQSLGILGSRFNPPHKSDHL